MKICFDSVRVETLILPTPINWNKWANLNPLGCHWMSQKRPYFLGCYHQRSPNTCYRRHQSPGLIIIKYQAKALASAEHCKCGFCQYNNKDMCRHVLHYKRDSILYTIIFPFPNLLWTSLSGIILMYAGAVGSGFLLENSAKTQPILHLSKSTLYTFWAFRVVTICKVVTCGRFISGPGI